MPQPQPGAHAPLATLATLATLAAILLFVAWNMGSWRELAQLRQFRQFRLSYRIILLTVFFLTVMVDLTVAVEVGLLASRGRSAPSGSMARCFFGAVQLVEDMENQLPTQALVLDLKNVIIYMDTTGVDTLKHLVHSCKLKGTRLIVCGLLGLIAAENRCPDLATGLAAATIPTSGS